MRVEVAQSIRDALKQVCGEDTALFVGRVHSVIASGAGPESPQAASLCAARGAQLAKRVMKQWAGLSTVVKQVTRTPDNPKPLTLNP